MFPRETGLWSASSRCFVFEVYLLNPTELSGSKNSSCFGTELIVAKPRAALVVQEGVQLQGQDVRRLGYGLFRNLHLGDFSRVIGD